MKKIEKYTATQLFNFTRDSYLERTSRPVYAIVFLLPFIIFYEIGTILINTSVLNRTQVRVVTFVWLQDILSYMGAGDRLTWIAPPLLVVLILIGLQIASKKQWYFCISDYLPMSIECILLAIPLIVLSLFLNGPSCSQQQAQVYNTECQYAYTNTGCSSVLAESTKSDDLPVIALNSNSESQRSVVARIVTGIGAGIYEELVFRLILICLLMLLFQDLFGLSHTNSIILSVLITAALFSAHHHVIFIDGKIGINSPFTWTEFGFRTIAGIYFALVFTVRGFGITAGSHAFYDIIATILNVAFFAEQ
jgi:hypothetical protein